MTATKVRTAVGAPEPDGLHLLDLANRAVAAHRAGRSDEAEALRSEGQALARRIIGTEEG